MKRLYCYGIILLLLSCNKQEPEMNSYVKVHNNDLNRLEMMQIISRTPIYFGHRSVGNNILNGIRQWEMETGVKLKIIESNDFSNIEFPSFVHFPIGRNGDPIGKIDAFVSAVDRIQGDIIAMAFFKFCFADIKDTTRIDPLFEYYSQHMLDLKANYPNVRIVLFTVPYTGIQKGAKAVVKRILGMPLGGQIENINRSAFNQRLVNELDREFPIYDLALIESTLPDGAFNRYKFRGGLFPSLADIYSNDLAHLNDFGSRVAADNLIAFLAKEVASFHE